MGRATGQPAIQSLSSRMIGRFCPSGSDSSTTWDTRLQADLKPYEAKDLLVRVDCRLLITDINMPASTAMSSRRSPAPTTARHDDPHDGLWGELSRFDIAGCKFTSLQAVQRSRGTPKAPPPPARGR